MRSIRIHATRLVVASSALFACAIAGRPAGAQVSILPKVRLKAGVFLAQNSSLSHLAGRTWFKVGADVSLPLGIPVLSGGTRVGIDYQANGSSNIIPVTLTSVFQPSLGLTSPVYVGAGIGLWTGHIEGHGTVSRLGARILGGVDIGKKTFFEIEYDFVDKMGDVHADGFSFLVGLKF